MGRGGGDLRPSFEPVADLERRDLLGQPRGEVRIHRVLDVDPVRADARLAAATELACDSTCAVNGLVIPNRTRTAWCLAHPLPQLGYPHRQTR